jgi:NAD(P)-dependent dehydrogenase (short-subunit alcohol dehydrogenase family)
MVQQSPNVLIGAISSDIGRELALMYRARGFGIIGTYRDERGVEGLRGQSGIELIHCDVSRPDNITLAAEAVAALGKPWDIFIGAVGQLAPIGKFFDTNIDDWCSSFTINSMAQLRLLHRVYPSRRAGATTRVAFLVGGGINGPFSGYSAYCLGKVALVKACELIDDEYPDIHAVAIGTGWVNTKIHRQTLDAAERAGPNYRRTYEFVTSGQPGTSYAEIFDCLEWCFAQDRAASGGRNFSVVHDAWRDGGETLRQALAADANKYKLRRSGN